MTIYRPAWQIGVAGRLFVRAAGDPYALVPAVTRVIREISPDQPVERAATLEDVRAEVLSPERVNAFVFSGFAGIALLIAVVGVAGVLAFSVSARTREFGVRLAVGSAPRHLLTRVLSEGVRIAAIGIAAGAAGGYVLARVAAGFVAHVQLPGALPILGAAAVLAGAAVLASLCLPRGPRAWTCCRRSGRSRPTTHECSHLAFTSSLEQLPSLSGLVALYAFKGGALHRKSGTIFVYAMLVDVAQRHCHGSRARGGGDQHPRGPGDGVSGDHRRSPRSARVPRDRRDWIAPPWRRRSRSAREAFWSRSPVAPGAGWRFRS